MFSEVALTFPLLFLMSASWSYMYLLLSFLSHRLDLATLLWSLAICNLTVSIPFSLRYRESPLGPAHLPARWRFQLLTLAATEVCLKVMAAVILIGSPLGDAVTLWNLSVVWAVVVQAALLREAPGVVQSGAVVIALVGVVLVQKPSFIFHRLDAGRLEKEFPDRKFHQLLAVICSIPYALLFVLTEHLQRREVHWSVFYLNNSVAQLAASSAATLAAPARHLAFLSSLTPLEGAGFVLVGIFDVLARSCLIGAVQRVGADVVAVFATLEIPVSYFLGFALLGQRPDGLGVAGSALIFAALMALTVKGAVRKRGEEEGAVRKRGEEEEEVEKEDEGLIKRTG